MKIFAILKSLAGMLNTNRKAQATIRPALECAINLLGYRSWKVHCHKPSQQSYFTLFTDRQSPSTYK